MLKTYVSHFSKQWKIKSLYKIEVPAQIFTTDVDHCWLFKLFPAIKNKVLFMP